MFGAIILFIYDPFFPIDLCTYTIISLGTLGGGQQRGESSSLTKKTNAKREMPSCLKLLLEARSRKPTVASSTAMCPVVPFDTSLSGLFQGTQ